MIPTLATNPTTARLRGVACQYGTPRGMFGCTIEAPDKAMAIFALTWGYVLVEIDGLVTRSGWLRERDVAFAAWNAYAFGRREHAEQQGGSGR